MKQESKGFGIAALVCGIFGLIGVMMPYFAIVLSILGIVFGSMQKKRGQTGVGTSGIVMGIIGCCLNALMFLLMIVYIYLIGIF